MRLSTAPKLLLSLFTLSCISFTAQAGPCGDHLFGDGFSRADTHKNRVMPSSANPTAPSLEETFADRPNILKRFKTFTAKPLSDQEWAAITLNGPRVEMAISQLDFKFQYGDGYVGSDYAWPSASQYISENSDYQNVNDHIRTDSPLSNLPYHLEVAGNAKNIESIFKTLDSDSANISFLVMNEVLEDIVTIEWLKLESNLNSLAKAGLRVNSDGSIVESTMDSLSLYMKGQAIKVSKKIKLTKDKSSVAFYFLKFRAPNAFLAEPLITHKNIMMPISVKFSSDKSDRLYRQPNINSIDFKALIISDAVKNSKVVNFNSPINALGPAQNEKLISANNYIALNSVTPHPMYMNQDSLNVSFRNIESLSSYLYPRLRPFELNLLSRTFDTTPERRAEITNITNSHILKALTKNLNDVVTIDFLMLETLLSTLTKQEFIKLSNGKFLRTPKTAITNQEKSALEFIEFLIAKIDEPEFKTVQALLYQQVGQSTEPLTAKEMTEAVGNSDLEPIPFNPEHRGSVPPSGPIDIKPISE